MKIYSFQSSESITLQAAEHHQDFLCVYNSPGRILSFIVIGGWAEQCIHLAMEPAKLKSTRFLLAVHTILVKTKMRMVTKAHSGSARAKLRWDICWVGGDLCVSALQSGSTC